MNKNIFITYLLLIGTNFCAITQNLNTITLQGVVISASSGKGKPNVTVGVYGVSDPYITKSYGQFEIKVNDVKIGDSITFFVNLRGWQPKFPQKLTYKIPSNYKTKPFEIIIEKEGSQCFKEDYTKKKYVGLLLPYKNDSILDKYEVVCGGITTGINKSDFDRDIIFMNNFLTYKFNTQRKCLQISGRFFDYKGRPIGELYGNSWAVDKSNDKLVINCDDNAIEVLDEFGIVVLSVRIEQPNRIIIKGITFVNGRMFIMGDKTTAMIGLKQPNLFDLYKEEGMKISRIFNYFSDNSGERN